MKEFIEKLIGRLEELANYNGNAYLDSADVFDEIKELAEEYKINTIIDGQYCWQTCGANEHCKECNRLCNGSIDYYENYEHLAEECDNRWISVGNRLPDSTGYYLCTVEWYGTSTKELLLMNGHSIEERVIMVHFLDSIKTFKCTDGFSTYKVLAWQPLPHKYEPKGE